MKFCIADMEGNGLLDSITKMHCFCYSIYEDNKFLRKGVINSSEGIYRLFQELEQENIILVGHNFARYDIPVIKKLFNIDYKGKLWDTLGMSYKLFPDQKRHGLEYYGLKYGVKKPEVEDWEGLSFEEYVHRCGEDVKINTILFGDLYSHFKEIYHPLSPNKDIDYVTWKMDCAGEMEQNPITIDKPLIFKTINEITEKFQEKKKSIESLMPKVPKYKIVNRPKKLLKKNGQLSVSGVKWLKACRDSKKDPHKNDSLKVIDHYKEPNAGSIDQIKSLLFSYGWQPVLFEARESKQYGVRDVPQIQDSDKNLCPDIERLSEKYEELKELQNFFMLRHRLGTFKSFLEESDDQDKIFCSVAGFTNTMRFRHRKPIANMPSVGKPYGEEIRGALKARDRDHLFCGSDMSSLEDTTKQHYMYFFDPEYVKEMRIPGFDPHTDIAVFADLMSKEEEKTFKKLKKKQSLYDEGKGEPLSKEEKDIFVYLSGIRKNAKVVNFAGVYGAGSAKIAKVLDCELSFAQKLHKTYWERNKAVKIVSSKCFYKKVRGRYWLWNPVANMYYYLKQKKDVFSTLNQGTGVYCFDRWLYKVRRKGQKIQIQYHDELGFDFLSTNRDKVITNLKTSIEEVNDELKLNVPLGISIDIGLNYGEAH